MTEGIQIEQGQTSTMKEKAVLFLKYLLAIVLIYVLLHYDIIRFEDIEVLLTSPLIWLAASFLVALALLIGVIRWKLILYGTGVRLPYLQLLQIYSISAFMGTFLPGAVGQDAVRTVYLVRQTPRGKTGAALSVIIDRAIGFFGFLGVSVLFIWIERETMLSSVVTTTLATSIVLLFLSMLAASIVLTTLAGPLSRSRFLQISKSRWLVRQKIFQAFSVVLGFKGEGQILFMAWLLSMLIPVLLVSCLVLFGMLHSGHPLGTSELMLGGFIANIANTIPLTPGGLGIGEGAFDQVCRLLESEPSGEAYGSIFLAFRATTIFVNLVFGSAFLIYSQVRRHE